MSESERALVVQTQQRAVKLLEELQSEKQQLLASKLEAAEIADGVQSLDAVIAALIKTATAAERALQSKGSST
ncbi:MAG TPA: hypothetical protein VGG19_10840 [Tepidisphaeraceae bacterium]|jgi:hypothetical protein